MPAYLFGEQEMKAMFVLVVLLPAVLLAGCVEEQAFGELAEEKAVLFLEKSQLPSGEFATYASPKEGMGDSVYNTSPFITSFVAHALSSANQTGKAGEMKHRAAEFIKSQKKEGATWNFWGLNEKGLYPEPPDDLDDTSCAAAVLVENGESIQVDFEEYRAENGAFFTWFAERENDIDCVVNANILFFYALQGKEDSRLCSYLNEAVESQGYLECTNYYPVSRFAFPYAISRAFADANASCIEHSLPRLQSFLLSRQENGVWGNDLDNALAVVSLLNLGFEGEELDKGIRNIKSRQKQDGSWESQAFFTGPYNCKKTGQCTYFGSAELTTAISLEAIAKYRKRASS